MVKLRALSACLAVLFSVVNAYADEDVIMRQVFGQACDARQRGDDARTAENRAVDKAGLDAVKKAGIIQDYAQNLNEQALNLISYRIIDEYLFDSEHQKTTEDSKQVCVEMSARLEMTPDDLVELINEYKYSAGPTEVEIKEAVEEVQQQIQFKPQNLNEKKLLYIKPLKFWNGVETANYANTLRESFASSSYFFVTDNQDMADYILMPSVEEAKVDAVDSQNRKMKMVVLLDIIATHDNSFDMLHEQQNHFILFAADKDEQKMADTLIKKLLVRGATSLLPQLDKKIGQSLESEKLLGK